MPRLNRADSRTPPDQRNRVNQNDSSHSGDSDAAAVVRFASGPNKEASRVKRTMAYAAAFAATITALTLPSAGNTPAQAAILRPVPAADQLDQVAVSDDMYSFHPLKIVAPVRTSWKVS